MTRDAVWRGTAGQDGAGQGMDHGQGKARRGTARQGEAGLGTARHGMDHGQFKSNQEMKHESKDLSGKVDWRNAAVDAQRQPFVGR